MKYGMELLLRRVKIIRCRHVSINEGIIVKDALANESRTSLVWGSMTQPALY